MHKINQKNYSLFFFVVVFLSNSFALADTEQEIRARVRSRQNNGARAEIRKCAMNISFAVGASACASYIVPESMSSMGGLVGMSTLYLFKDKFANVLSYSGMLEPTENLQRAQRLNALEEEFELNKHDMLAYNREELERLIREARSNVGYGVVNVYEYQKTAAEIQLNKIKVILRLPLKPSKALNEEELDEALRELKNHLRTYSDEVHDQVMKAAVMVSGQSQNPLSAEKASFLFIGEAGVGKTETAKAFAVALKRPFCSLNLGSSAIEDFYGRPPVNSNNVDQVGELGSFYRCFVSPDSGTAASDPVIFIDEIHDVLNGKDKHARNFYSLFKLISEDGEKEIQENALRIKLSLKNVIFLFGSNEDFKSDAAGALATRMHKVNFSNICKEQKKVIAAEYLEKLYMKNYFSEDNDGAMIESIVIADDSPGARVLKQVIKEYKNHQRTCSLTSLRCARFNIPAAIKAFGGTVNPMWQDDAAQ